jgi:hypothetical protein
MPPGWKICGLNALQENAYAVSLCFELEPTPRPIKFFFVMANASASVPLQRIDISIEKRASLQCLIS